MSWTGSESSRREQTAEFETAPTVEKHRFHIPAGSTVEVCRVADSESRWRKHTTKLSLTFDRYERREGASVVFRHYGYFIRTFAKQARDRQADSGEPLR